VRCSSAYSSIDAWPLLSTKRSRSGQPGLAGEWRRGPVKRLQPTAASPIGAPGCPLAAASTASIARVRTVVAQASGGARTVDTALLLSSDDDLGRVYPQAAHPRLGPPDGPVMED
jgi:hypothetical protein